jgi:hypothetical protein
MKGNIQIIVTTVALFVAGLLVGIWTQRTRPFPPPPFPPMGEFGRPHGPGFGEMFPPPPPMLFGNSGAPEGPPSPDEMRKRMTFLRPQIAQFQQRLDSIEDNFRNSLGAILNPTQRQKLDEIKKRVAALPPPMPGCGSEMGPVFVSMVIYRPLYDRMSADLGLDERQQQQLKQLLIERRNELLALVDNTPPPSFRFGEVVKPQPGGP